MVNIVLVYLLTSMNAWLSAHRPHSVRTNGDTIYAISETGNLMLLLFCLLKRHSIPDNLIPILPGSFNLNEGPQAMVLYTPVQFNSLPINAFDRHNLSPF